MELFDFIKISSEKWSLPFESSNVHQVKYQIRFREESKISMQELMQLDLPAYVAVQLLSIYSLERLMDS